MIISLPCAVSDEPKSKRIFIFPSNLGAIALAANKLIIPNETRNVVCRGNLVKEKNHRTIKATMHAEEINSGINHCQSFMIKFFPVNT